MSTIHSNDLTSRRLSDMSDIDRMWLAEFGQPVEVVVRIVAIAVAGVGLWAYNGWLAGPIWAASYLSLLALCYFTLRPENPFNPVQWAIGLASESALSITFAALPIFVLASDDPVLLLCGALSMVTLAIFTLMREEPPAIIQPVDIAIMWAAILVVWIGHVAGHATLGGQAIMTLTCVVGGGYYTSALISSRTMKESLRHGAQKLQNEQKLAAIGDLSGGIAHDFNNILTVLQGSLELYHEVPAGPEREALVSDARTASARATGLVAQLLAFARRAPLDPRAHSAGPAVDTLAKTARGMLDDHVVLDTRTMADPVMVMADPDGLQAALLNLVLNAQEALDRSGSINVAVDLCLGPATEARSAPAETTIGAHLRFSVADDGPGLAPEVLVKALDPFFTTKPAGKGSGMGLPMALGFAEQSGGALRIKTSDDGTTVALHLPIAG